MSIHPDTLALIHATIDGVATEAEQLLLRDAIARDAEVRDEYRRLCGLCALLAQIEPEEPPAQVVPGVMRAVRAHRGTPRGGFARRVRDLWPGGRVALRYAYAVAAGAVVGILGSHLAAGGGLFGPAVPERDATATIGPSHDADRLDLAPAGIRGFATVRPSVSGTAIGLDLSAAEPVEFVLRYEPAKDGGRVDVLVVRGGEATQAGSLRLPQRN
jgi:anti-sigma factor RsiW